MSTPTTPQPPAPKPQVPIKKQNREGSIAKFMTSLRLKFRLANDRRVNPLLRILWYLLFFIGIPWILIPDFIPYVDDAAILWLLANFEDLCPPHVVAEHKRRLAKEKIDALKAEQEATKQAATPTQPAAPQPQEEDEDVALTVAVTRSGKWVTFHFTTRVRDVIAANRALKKDLSGLGELDLTNNALRTPQSFEGDVATTLGRRIPGLRLRYPRTTK